MNYTFLFLCWYGLEPQNVFPLKQNNQELPKPGMVQEVDCSHVPQALSCCTIPIHTHSVFSLRKQHSPTREGMTAGLWSHRGGTHTVIPPAFLLWFLPQLIVPSTSHTDPLFTHKPPFLAMCALLVTSRTVTIN
jgi:hypothetical protein